MLKCISTMTQHKTILLTGGLGFLGMELLKRLMALNHHVKLLVRRKNGVIPEIKLRNKLLCSGLEDGKVSNLLERVEIIEGNIDSSQLGIESSVLESLNTSVDEVLHCAASTKFSGIDRDEMFKTNYLGSLNLIKFCLSGKKKHFHAVSSAYVAGKKNGIIYEYELDSSLGFRNYYEETKFLAEKAVHRFAQLYDLTYTVYRPGIIIGDSKKFYTLNFDGIYTFARSLLALKRRFNSIKGTKVKRFTAEGVCRSEIGGTHAIIDNNLFDDNPSVRLPANPTSTLNLVPIDYVADAVIAIFLNKGRLNKTFHIVNPNPPKLHFLMEVLSESVGFFEAEIVDYRKVNSDQLTQFESTAWKSIDLYFSYLKDEPSFMSNNTLSILNNSIIKCPRITKQYISSIIDYAVRNKWGNDKYITL